MVSTAKKNAPSNRASRLRTASYLLSSSVMGSSVPWRERRGWRESDMEPRLGGFGRRRLTLTR
ncbi:hypothetical protein GCM10010233_12840 [Streptomyces pseudogriseolus]|uniref:Uncharacterized protein n=1 Tax=Streptomyces pseudogriseolus TaxID=36817 RepID=A0ABQ2SI62_STREZ|nr:hypothetical protein GCM10010233_12840 [Streptomyces gancidicus]GGS27913.1 hypothetical protein GCM10010285_02490 [Streptomyces rubiginosus]